MLSYLKKRIEANQGISISKLPGHMSQLPPDVRAKYGGNEEAIRKFLEEHSGVFVIDKSDRVFLRPVPSPARMTALEVTTEEVTALCNVSGKVLRIFPNFGFLTVEQPFKTTVYFDLKSFEEGRHTTLVSSGLSEGDCVTLDATRSVGHKASFKATRVERIGNGAATPSSTSKPAKEPSADGDNRLRNQSGIIHTVKPGYGFITFGPKKKNCAFFHSSVVDKALTKGNKNLADILTTKDRVHFDATPDDSKGSKWVKWKATRVWRVPPELDSAVNSDTDSGDEVFMSEDEADMESILKDDSDTESSDVNVEDYPVGYPDWEDNPEKPLPPGDQSSEKKSVSWTSRRMLSMIKGIFFKQSDKVGYVCSLDGNATACVVIPVVYHMGAQIKSFDELPWSSGIEQLVEVFFDAVEDDDMWVATLVWTGERPPRLPVNCSEHIFNAVRAMAKIRHTRRTSFAYHPAPSCLPTRSVKWKSSRRDKE
ncbi:hypothetical protein HPB50_005602 [Hyalomma asiaticum]|uniref:Uncharacterized protein n=1 Tax=Hyalomma asiaticum TaxID=266040 RepID=A0ACB7RHI5_HYAAI|nr:hypothetical protein HPB50_005602 [Hyalomma asiaticum]